jgi:hypothetical protein
MINNRESTTGIAIPSVIELSEGEHFSVLLDSIASFCASRLLDDGYLSDEEYKCVLSDYRSLNVTGGQNTHLDFLAFVGHERVNRDSPDLSNEIRKMQQVLRRGATGKVPFWGFGPILGKPDILFQACPSLRSLCVRLSCPVIVIGDPAIIHVASVNPVAALVTAALVEREMALLPSSLIPFVFPMIVDLQTWKSLIKNHLDL